MEKETCTLCGKQTEVDVSTPISERENYVECAGQLCPECYEEVYGKN